MQLLVGLLPKAPGFDFTLIEFNEEAEAQYMLFDDRITNQMEYYKKSPLGDYINAVLGKSLGSIVKEAANACLCRISFSVVSSAAELKGYTGHDIKVFEQALLPKLREIIKKADKDELHGLPQLIDKTDFLRGYITLTCIDSQHLSLGI